MPEKFSLKDHLFNAAKVHKIAVEIAQVYPALAQHKFEEEVLQAFPNLELKERIYHITSCLKKYLPPNFEQAITILVQALPAPCNPLLSDNDFGDFIYAPYTHYVAMYGCEIKHLPLSFWALEEISTRFSAEDAIRYFINAFPAETLAQMQLWATHSHYHVRRLASEGLRPKLPWCQKIHLPVEAALPILHKLHADTTRFVTRSVANHLNDISKTHPSLVITALQQWKSTAQQSEAELHFIIKHALRTLIKNGDAAALSLLNFGSNTNIAIQNFRLNQSLQMGQSLQFSFDILAKDSGKLMIDYLIYFRSKNGEINRKKVFKLKQVSVQKGEQLSIQKSQLLLEKMSTRTLYPGEQGFALQINGQLVQQEKFVLLTQQNNANERS
jgi:3-methyladenine DNA glycosylase AlkC